MRPAIGLLANTQICIIILRHKPSNRNDKPICFSEKRVPTLPEPLGQNFQALKKTSQALELKSATLDFLHQPLATKTITAPNFYAHAPRPRSLRSRKHSPAIRHQAMLIQVDIPPKVRSCSPYFPLNSHPHSPSSHS